MEEWSSKKLLGGKGSKTQCLLTVGMLAGRGHQDGCHVWQNLGDGGEMHGDELHQRTLGFRLGRTHGLRF